MDVTRTTSGSQTLVFRVVAGLFGAVAFVPSVLFVVGVVDTPWAIATLAWGAVVVALTEIEARRSRSAVTTRRLPPA